jgi:hypothetical protein
LIFGPLVASKGKHPALKQVTQGAFGIVLVASINAMARCCALAWPWLCGAWLGAPGI